MSTITSKRYDLVVLLGLLAVFLIAIPIVDPRGDFPLNDDWSFAGTTRRLALNHEWQPGWGSMTLVTQALWGAAACLLSDCSFESLRWSTIAASLVLIVLSYQLYRLAHASAICAFVATAVTVFNPITYALTFTYMTDVFFETLLVASAIFCVRALQRQKSIDVGLAALLITAATLCRQLALCLSVGFCIAYWIVSGEPAIRRAGKAVFPLLLSVMAFVAYDQWIRRTGRMPPFYDEKTEEMIATLALPVRSLVKVVLNNTFSVALYLGLFSLPVGLCIESTYLRRSANARSMRIALAASLGSLMVAAWLFYKHALMPVSGNIINKSGIGPFTLRDTYVLDLDNIPSLPEIFWFVITILSLIGISVLLFHVITLGIALWTTLSTTKLPVPLSISIFGLASLLAYLAPLVVSPYIFDRYFADVIPLICLILVPLGNIRITPPKYFRLVLAVLWAGLLPVFSIPATHDYLSWNRARWRAIGDLERSSEADAKTLDGGYEYNGYRGYDPAYVKNPSKSWWWVQDDQIQLSFGPMPNSQIIRRYDYVTYLPPDTRSIYVSRRLN
jgi:hypothetical protein